MRPKEVWDKTQGPDGGAGGPRKRASQSQKGKPDSFPPHSTTDDASGGTAFFSDGSSPVDANEQHNGTEASQLCAPTRPRASSVQPGRSNPSRVRLNDSTAAAALQRAIQSSPVHQRSVQQKDTAGKDLTPKPTRRILFPSPTQNGQYPVSQSKDSTSMQGASSSLAPYTYEKFDPADKENLPPQCGGDEQDNIDDEPILRSVTPSPSNKTNEKAFKTPNRSLTPDRKPPTTGDFFSSAAKALLRPHSTPKHTLNRPNSSQPLGEISPFTAQINAILSDANNVSPTHSHFDFPALPSLNNTPGRMRHGFDLSQFDPQDLLSTDVAMASSPPVGGWFGVYEDPNDKEANWWSQYGFPDSSPPVASEEKAKAKAALAVDKNGRATIQVSPVPKQG